ncbi:hypothetical protein AB9K26_03170 [Psychroserpens sp. XS_ASV72]|uniref:hypothetical protein n=1 Tax=Psychroserpens sp. XS_ASV72 TaxID=3241293 RepID=UPI003515C8CF
MKFIIFCFSLGTSLMSFSQSDIKKDIEDKYLMDLHIDQDSTLMTEFQRYAVDLFKTGTSVNDTILKSDTYKVGVALISSQNKTAERDVAFTLYTLCYKDLREKDFHKSIYFGSGREGLSNFFVDHDTEEQKKMIDEAVLTYLKFDSIPVANPAYQFAKTYFVEDTYYDKFYSTDKHSTLKIGNSYAYLRQNGNYIIQIEGFPDKTLHDDTEMLYVNDVFVDDWFAISVFIIDDSSGKAYNTIFKFE